jgi:vacuolar protein-sorting-associated protein 4
MALAYFLQMDTQYRSQGMKQLTKIKILKTMINSDQTNAAAWFLLGLEHAERGERTEALQAFTQALAHGDEELKEKIVMELNKLSSKTPLHRGYKPHEMTMRVIEGGKGKREEKTVNIKEKRLIFAEVGGLQEVKTAIRMKIIQPFLTPDLYERFHKRPGGSVLLYGPPGCGKSFIAKATAGECQAKFFTVQIADILDPYLGVSEQNIREQFDRARSHMPAVLFLDEMDALGFNRGKSSSPLMRGVIDQLLLEMEKVESSADRLLLIGATNMPWDVDPAFKRPGRFDQMIFVGPPDLEAREAIFRLKLAGRPCEPIDYPQLAAWTDLYSGADIEYVVELATEQVLQDILSKGVDRPIRMSDLRESIAATRPTTIEWLRTVKNYVKYANQDGQYSDVEHFLARNKRI